MLSVILARGEKKDKASAVEGPYAEVEIGGEYQPEQIGQEKDGRPPVHPGEGRRGEDDEGDEQKEQEEGGPKGPEVEKEQGPEEVYRKLRRVEAKGGRGAGAAPGSALIGEKR